MLVYLRRMSPLKVGVAVLSFSSALVLITLSTLMIVQPLPKASDSMATRDACKQQPAKLATELVRQLQRQEGFETSVQNNASSALGVGEICWGPGSCQSGRVCDPAIGRCVQLDVGDKCWGPMTCMKGTR